MVFVLFCFFQGRVTQVLANAYGCVTSLNKRERFHYTTNFLQVTLQLTPTLTLSPKQSRSVICQFSFSSWHYQWNYSVYSIWSLTSLTTRNALQNRPCCVYRGSFLFIAGQLSILWMLVQPFLSGGTARLFPGRGSYEFTCSKYSNRGYCGAIGFNFSRACLPRRKIVGSYGKCMFNFIRDWQAVSKVAVQSVISYKQ